MIEYYLDQLRRNVRAFFEWYTEISKNKVPREAPPQPPRPPEDSKIPELKEYKKNYNNLLALQKQLSFNYVDARTLNLIKNVINNFFQVNVKIDLKELAEELRRTRRRGRGSYLKEEANLEDLIRILVYLLTFLKLLEKIISKKEHEGNYENYKRDLENLYRKYFNEGKTIEIKIGNLSVSVNFLNSIQATVGHFKTLFRNNIKKDIGFLIKLFTDPGRIVESYSSLVDKIKKEYLRKIGELTGIAGIGIELLGKDKGIAIGETYKKCMEEIEKIFSRRRRSKGK